ncbi:MAG: thioredoxin family protein [Desulfamplus sp.]|nr:thioredoxin family protein [Desulfamplus sp.]
MSSFEENSKKNAIEWHARYSEKNINITFLGSEEHFANVIVPVHDLLPQYRAGLSDTIRGALSTLEIPVELKLYVASQCPHCPGVIRSLIPLAAEFEKIHLTIIDGTIHTELASSDSIMSVPSLILDNGFRWTGSVNPEEVADIIANRDLSSLSTSSLKSILEEGKAQWIARQMLDYKTMFPGFTALITHETWSVRLGAMVVIETIAEKSPELALTIAPELLGRFKDVADTPTQGDILYALGEIGDKSVRKDIIQLMNDISHPEVMEAAQAAVESIESRSAIS